jgi:hypothetical protein
MSSEKAPSDLPENELKARRTFLSQVGKAAVTAPAIGLLLAASSTPAAAQYRPDDNSGTGESESGEVEGRERQR